MRVKNPPVFEASNNNDTNKTKRASAKQAIRPFLIVSPGSEKKRTIVFGFPDRENSRLTEKRGILKKFARGTSGTIFSPTGENNDCFPPASKKKTIVLGFGRPVRRLFSEGDPKTIHFFRIPPPDKERPKSVSQKLPMDPSQPTTPDNMHTGRETLLLPLSLTPAAV